MRALRYLLLLSLAVSTCHSAAVAELEDRVRIESATRQAFALGNFQRLEDDSSAYRTTKARTSSGLWKLTLFYKGLSDALAVRELAAFDLHFRYPAQKVQSYFNLGGQYVHGLQDF